MLRDGVDVEYPRPDGSIAGDKMRLIDFEDVRANDFFAVNQFTVIENQHNRRPDIVVFVNGLPLGLIELKNAVAGGVLPSVGGVGRGGAHFKPFIQFLLSALQQVPRVQ